jgi:putative DNA primase/helicase
MGQEKTSMTNDITEILESLHARRSGTGWIARCPAHEDKAPSLSLRVTETGRLLAYCHAGCSFRKIREALGLSGERFAPSPQKEETGPTPEQLEAQAKAVRLWQGAKPANPQHSYLIRKKIQAHQARQFGNTLLIPMQDARGDLWNCQLIFPDGLKRFLKGGRTKGLFSVLGESSGADRIYIAEGFATAATIHELVGKPVFIGFSAHNLPEASRIVRRAFPKAEIVLAADADPAGEKYSEEAARAVNGLICYAGRA